MCLHRPKQQPERIFVHIGYDKTGTTSIQRRCNALRSLLLGDSVLYPCPKEDSFHHLELARTFGFSWADQHQLAHDDDALKSIRGWYADQLRDNLYSRVLLSSEHLCYYVDIQSLIEFKKWLNDSLPGVPISIIIYIRDQISWFLSVYSESIKWGIKANIDDFFEIAKGRLHYKRLVNDWSRVFGHNNIIIKDFSKERVRLLVSFSEILALSHSVAECYRNHPIGFANQAMRQVFLETLRRNEFGLSVDAAYDLINMNYTEQVHSNLAPSFIWRLPAEFGSRVEALNAENIELLQRFGLALDSDLTQLPRLYEEYQSRVEIVPSFVLDETFNSCRVFRTLESADRDQQAGRHE